MMYVAHVPVYGGRAHPSCGWENELDLDDLGPGGAQHMADLVAAAAERAASGYVIALRRGESVQALAPHEISPADALALARRVARMVLRSRGAMHPDASALEHMQVAGLRLAGIAGLPAAEVESGLDEVAALVGMHARANTMATGGVAKYDAIGDEMQARGVALWRHIRGQLAHY